MINGAERHNRKCTGYGLWQSDHVGQAACRVARTAQDIPRDVSVYTT